MDERSLAFVSSTISEFENPDCLEGFSVQLNRIFDPRQREQAVYLVTYTVRALLSAKLGADALECFDYNCEQGVDVEGSIDSLGIDTSVREGYKQKVLIEVLYLLRGLSVSGEKRVNYDEAKVISHAISCIKAQLEAINRPERKRRRFGTVEKTPEQKAVAYSINSLKDRLSFEHVVDVQEVLVVLSAVFEFPHPELASRFIGFLGRWAKISEEYGVVHSGGNFDENTFISDDQLNRLLNIQFEQQLKCTSFSISHTVWGLGRLGEKKDEAVRLAKILYDRCEESGLSDISLTVWGLGRLGGGKDLAVGLAGKFYEKILRGDSPKKGDIGKVVCGLGHLLAGRDIALKLAVYLSKEYGLHQVDDVSMTLWGLGKFGVGADVAHRLAVSFSEKMKISSRRVLRVFDEDFDKRGGYEVSQLAMIVWGLSRLGVQDKELVELFAGKYEERVNEATPSNVGMIADGLGHLGIGGDILERIGRDSLSKFNDESMTLSIIMLMEGLSNLAVGGDVILELAEILVGRIIFPGIDAGHLVKSIHVLGCAGVGKECAEKFATVLLRRQYVGGGENKRKVFEALEKLDANPELVSAFAVE